MGSRRFDVIRGILINLGELLQLFIDIVIVQDRDVGGTRLRCVGESRRHGESYGSERGKECSLESLEL